MTRKTTIFWLPFLVPFRVTFGGGKMNFLGPKIIPVAPSFRVLKGHRGGTQGNVKDSVWEDWGTLGKIRGITTPP